jgi:hypothetical protein
MYFQYPTHTTPPSYPHAQMPQQVTRYVLGNYAIQREYLARAYKANHLVLPKLRGHYISYGYRKGKGSKFEPELK